MPDIHAIRGGAVGNQQVVEKLSSSEKSLIKDFLKTERKRTPVMRSTPRTMTADRAGSPRPLPPIVARYMHPPVMRYLNPIIPGEDDKDIITAICNRVVDNKIISATEARLLKKVFNKEIADARNPAEVREIKKFLKKVIASARPMTKAAHAAIYGRGGPLEGSSATKVKA